MSDAGDFLAFFVSRLDEALHMQETTHQIEAVPSTAPRPASLPHVVSSPNHWLQNATTAGARGRFVRYAAGVAEGKRFTFRFRSGTLSDVWRLVFGVWFPTAE